MLLQFSFSNFKSFRGTQTLSLAANNRDKSLPGNCIEPNLPGLIGKRRRWNKGGAIYGANASGKSSVLNAFYAITDMVRKSAKTTDPKEPISQIEHFGLDEGKKNEPTAFVVSFIQQEQRFEYRVAATGERIIHESLSSYPSPTPRVWFTRDWSSARQDYDYSSDSAEDFQRDQTLEARTLPNVLHLSKLVSENNRQVEPVYRWFKERVYFLNLGAGEHLGENFSIAQFAQKTALANRMLELLRHADLGITGGSVRETRPDETEFQKLLSFVPEARRDELKKAKFMEAELLHRGAGGRSFPLKWDSESAGTRRMFALAGPWLDILQEGYVVCIDELETSMHPLIVRELLRLFFCDRENSKRAQILFTTHNPLLLDLTLLRRDQVWFTDKDNEGASHLYPLTKFEPRQGESLVRGYMAGRYGAIPFVPSGLLNGSLETEAVGEETRT